MTLVSRWEDSPVAPAPAPAHQCGQCRQFEPGAINPVAGVGYCTTRATTTYPMQGRYCRLFTERGPSD